MTKSSPNNYIANSAYNKDNELIACNFCMIDSNKATYLFGGFSSEHKQEGAVALVMWESIKQAKAKGIKIFDFEGSMIPQIEKFFRGFGGNLTPFYRVNKANILVEILLKIKEKARF